MAELQTKTCLCCGKPFDNQSPDMRAGRFAVRKYCSLSCSSKRKRPERHSQADYELQPLVAVCVKIDTDAPLFKFMSGQHRRDCHKIG